MQKAKVIKSTGSWYKLLLDDGKMIEAKIKGNLRLKKLKTTNPVAVGDDVLVEIRENMPALITEVLPAKNHIIRKPSNLSKQYHIIASNVDQALLVCSIVHPYTSKMFIDRFLISAESYEIPVIIVVNKCDLWQEKEAQIYAELEDIYIKAGYKIMFASVKQHVHIEEIKGLLKNKTTVLSGMSGVGKSSLINAVEPSLSLKTAEISAAHKTGKHTTTFAEMYPFSFGGFLIDTPGIRSFGIADFDKEKLSHYFPEMRALMHQCKFHNCRHINEPGCAVKEAVVRGEIAESRYINYLEIYYDENEKYR